VLADLEAQDYATRAFIVPACGVNAPHRRDRLWIIAHTDSHGEPDGTINEKQGCRKLVGNSEHNGSSAATVSGKYGEDETGCKEGQSQAEQFEGASKPGHDAYVGDAAHNGRNWGAAQVGRERAQDQPDESQSGVWCEPSRSGENVADTNGEGLQGHTNANRQRLGQSRRQQITDQSFSGRKENVADTDSERGRGWYAQRQDAEDAGQSPGYQEHRGRNIKSRICDLADGLPTRMDGFDGWEREPADIPRVATGIKQRAARLKGLGNAIVPQIAMNIGLTIKAMIDE
jgi:DNA (cytosine-5)-methyltransferase 1